MSRLPELPKEVSEALDQSKAYHVVKEDEDSPWSPMVCGVLEPTGNIASYSHFTLPELRCLNCNKIEDVANYDHVYVGKNCDYAG